MSAVPLYIGSELSFPEFPPCPGGGAARAVCVTVPETAMDEQHQAVPREYYIGSAGKVTAM